ncbi:hypothetical protein GBF38_002975 [Nibea albiflora]|uniref:Uncharacterized protein n=1 Tax=Nibea albiflora TaxID=240163 RepID=A0ACB7FKD5_NIBAL|nr:hypothetical protein GBF38_002975 [Nibea albiflora]
MVHHVVQKQQCPETKTVDVSIISAEVIWCIHIGESSASDGRSITVDDRSNTRTEHYQAQALYFLG